MYLHFIFNIIFDSDFFRILFFFFPLSFRKVYLIIIVTICYMCYNLYIVVVSFVLGIEQRNLIWILRLKGLEQIYWIKLFEYLIRSITQLFMYRWWLFYGNICVLQLVFIWRDHDDAIEITKKANFEYEQKSFFFVSFVWQNEHDKKKLFIFIFFTNKNIKKTTHIP